MLFPVTPGKARRILALLTVVGLFALAGCTTPTPNPIPEGETTLESREFTTSTPQGPPVPLLTAIPTPSSTVTPTLTPQATAFIPNTTVAEQ